MTTKMCCGVDWSLENNRFWKVNGLVTGTLTLVASIYFLVLCFLIPESELQTFFQNTYKLKLVCGKFKVIYFCLTEFVNFLLNFVIFFRIKFIDQHKLVVWSSQQYKWIYVNIINILDDSFPLLFSPFIEIFRNFSDYLLGFNNRYL